MTRTKLVDVCDFQGGSQPPKDQWKLEQLDGYVRMLQIRDFTQSSSVTPEYVKISKSLKLCEKDDILIARYGASLGKILTGLSGAYNVAIMRTIPDLTKIDRIYLKYYLLSNSFQNYILSIGSRAAQAGFNKEELSKLTIELPQLSEQHRIIRILELVDDNIVRYEKQLDDLNLLVKSRFIEMFGEPSVNSKHWKESRLEDVIIGKASNGFFAKPEKYSNDGEIGVICVGDVVNRKYSNIKNLRRINMDKASFKKYKVTYGDILFCRSSLVKEGIAKASIVPKNSKNEVFECHVIRIKLDTNILIPEYMQAMSTTDYFRNQMIRMSKTATMTTIGQKDIISSSVLVPPIEIQNQFVDFATQVDKSKLAVQQSLNELETLKKSLMQQYFG